MKILQKEDKYIKMIPEGCMWTKISGSSTSKKIKKKRMPISRFINEYKTHIEAGYVDQTDIYMSVKEPVNFFAMEDIDGRNLYKKLYDMCELYTSRIFEKTGYTNAQIFAGEDILRCMKDTLDNEREFGRHLARFYNTLFKKINPLSWENIDTKAVYEKEYNDLLCLKASMETYMPEIRKIADKTYSVFNQKTKGDLEEYMKGKKGKLVTLYHSSPDICWYSILNNGLVSKPPRMLHGNYHGDGIYFTDTPNQMFSDKYTGTFEVFLTDDNHEKFPSCIVLKDEMAVNQIELRELA